MYFKAVKNRFRFRLNLSLSPLALDYVFIDLFVMTDGWICTRPGVRPVCLTCKDQLFLAFSPKQLQGSIALCITVVSVKL